MRVTAERQTRPHRQMSEQKLMESGDSDISFATVVGGVPRSLQVSWVSYATTRGRGEVAG